MDALTKQLKKVLSENKDLMKMSEQVIAENREKIKDECSPEQLSYIDSVLADAKAGKTVDVNAFAENFKNIK